MTVAPTRYCSADPTCPNTTTDGGPCAEHAQQKERARVNWAWRRLYRTPRWKWTRRAVLDDQPLCADCVEQNVELPEPSVDVHHRVRPTDEEMFFDRENLMGLCKPHHSVRTQRGE